MIPLIKTREDLYDLRQTCEELLGPRIYTTDTLFENGWIELDTMVRQQIDEDILG